MNPPDEISPASLSAAAHTLRDSRSGSDTLLVQLSQAASLLGALPATPTAPSLVFRRPGVQAVECVTIGAGVTAGRGEGCEIRFVDRQELSRQHFAVRPEGALFFVEDPGSSNGTSVEGVEDRITRRELRDGDLIRAGGIVFLFVKPV